MFRTARRIGRKTVRKSVKVTVRTTVKVTKSAARGTGKAVKSVEMKTDHKPLVYRPSERMNRWRTVSF
jgi:hypothetical protein